ncbi:uncharacterized protein LOC141881840 isoform X2 [Acropora palmata]|uniref:uncharacterized protein LOC141881840 isoform X2 n=1 Tax=Acropora palmata TaxID=6131 RepID=UPI003DA02781
MSTEPEQMRKIFVGGLNRRTTEESLKDYFSLWGNIVDCVIMREGKNGPSRGFGFVTFDSSQAVDDCLTVKRHELDNWEIEPKRSVPKGEAQSRTRKIFVGGLASTATEADVEDYFGKLCQKSGCGKVVDVDLKRDKENPNRLRGFAFVTFDSEEIVEKICSISFHQIKMKQCEVKKAESQAAMRKKEEQEMKASGRSRDREYDSDLGLPLNWAPNAGFGGLNQGIGGPNGRGNVGGMNMSGFGGGNFSNPAAAAALLSGLNPAAFSGFNPMAMGPGFGFNGMGFNGFGPSFFGGFGGFSPGGFGAGGGGNGGGGTSVGTGFGVEASSYGGSGPRLSSSSTYEKDNYADVAYGLVDMKGSSASERNSSAGIPGAATDSISNAMATAYGHGALPGGFGGFPGIGDWSQLAGMSGSGSGVGRGSDYQIGNYNQMNSNYGPAGRLNSRGSGVGDKSNRGYRPY